MLPTFSYFNKVLCIRFERKTTSDVESFYSSIVELVIMLIMDAAIFSKLSLKIVQFNGALRQTAEA